MQQEKDNIPNHNILLEQYVLGGIITKNSLYDKVSVILTKEDFFHESHKKIYHIISQKLELGEHIDAIILLHLIDDSHKEYIIEMVENALPNTESITEYAEIIKQMSLKRKLITIGQKIQEPVTLKDVYEQIRWCENEIFNIHSHTNNGIILGFYEGSKVFLQHTKQLLEKKVDIIGVPSCLPSMDQITGGFKPGELIILAGRPSMGKTALGINIATHAAQKNYKVLFISLEMPYDQICARIISYITEIPLYNLLQAKLSPQVFQSCVNQVDKLNDLPMTIYDHSFVNINAIRSIVRQYKRQEMISLVVLDYLQLIDSVKSFESREQEVSKISRALKLIAKEMGVSMLVLSQMSREIEKRKDGDVPKLSDLRGSGSIEQDADIILFLYGKKTEEEREIILNIAKNRNGALGEIKLEFQKEIASFEEKTT